MGISLDVLAGTTPLTCDAEGLRRTCQAPNGMAGVTRSQTAGSALVLPTRACLRSHLHRTTEGVLKLYGIGPVAQAVFAPALAITESKAVDRLDRLRALALFKYWLFEHAELSIEQKRGIAAARIEDWGGSVEVVAASAAGLAKWVG